MTTMLRARYDGKVLVPEGEVDLPVGRELVVQVSEATSARPPAPLSELAHLARSFPRTEGPTTDRAAQHDHYLYGLPKRP